MAVAAAKVVGLQVAQPVGLTEGVASSGGVVRSHQAALEAGAEAGRVALMVAHQAGVVVVAMEGGGMEGNMAVWTVALRAVVMVAGAMVVEWVVAMERRALSSHTLALAKMRTASLTPPSASQPGLRQVQTRWAGYQHSYQ